MATGSLNYEDFSGYSPYSTVGPYRASDYWKLPEGAPVELLRGRLIVSPSPTALHQLIVSRLIAVFEKVCDATDGLVFPAPMDVVLGDETILQPDLVYVRADRRSIVGERVQGSPDLVVEIISPGSDQRDRLEKLDIYAQHGIAEYWIVDPEQRVFEFLINRDGRFEVASGRDNRYASAQFPEVQVDLAEFWQVIDRRLAK
jgi:Uma2 family endonuclease